MSDAYFRSLCRAVAEHGVHAPVLCLDHDRFTRNLEIIRKGAPQGVALRVADKSLPVPDLLARTLRALGSTRVMSFHLPLTRAVIQQFPEVDVLMGKPMPIAAIAQFLSDEPKAERIVWLADRREHLDELRSLARARDQRLRVAYEVDIGLGRGGFLAPEDLRAALTPDDFLISEGIMGYEAHVNALPTFLGKGRRAGQAAAQRLDAFVDVLPPEERKIINTGGSSTFLGLETSLANDVTVGSLAVKPSDFDQDINAAIEPALFIVTPLLKVHPHGLPGHPRLSRLLRRAHVIRDRVGFVYGGNWMANPVWPAGLQPSPFFGHSSNQEGYTLPRGQTPETHVVLRPTQSEAVLQQFSQILVFEKGKGITESLRPFAIL